MARTDENGRDLQVVLGYMLNRAITAKDIYGALGIARNTYNGREKEDSFPNAEECRLMAEHFTLNPVELMLTFGLISQHDLEPYTGAVATKKVSRKAGQRIPRLSEMAKNPDVPEL